MPELAIVPLKFSRIFVFTIVDGIIVSVAPLFVSTWQKQFALNKKNNMFKKYFII